MLSDTFSSLFSSLASCCGAREKPRSRTSSPGRNIVVLRDQPAVVPRPSAEPIQTTHRPYEMALEREREKERERARLRRPASRDSNAVRKTWFSSRSSSSTRRLQISGPTNFRHLHSESFQFPPPVARPQVRRRPRSFRPIELSIYQPYNRLSPILPHLESEITPPRRTYTASSGTTLVHERSYSTMSFHIPRKHARHESGISDDSATPPRIPPKSRARANTAPSPERIIERIASALIEKERLQAEIDSVMERQSIYISSRPSTGYDMRGLEPMPSIPALPAAAPSFAERLSVDDRPRTAPSHMASMSFHPQTPISTSTPPSYPPQPSFPASHHTSTASEKAAEQQQAQQQFDPPLAPPLPLVLRPPLRKKKSFSRVSNWLLQHPDDEQQPHPGLQPAAIITNAPRPTKPADGFYQCVAPPEGLPRTSMETSSSVYTWETGSRDGDGEDEEDESKTVPTTTAWSPSPEQTPKLGGAGSSSTRHTSPVIGSGGVLSVVDGKAGLEKEMLMSGGLGVVVDGHRPLSVGVAF